MSLKYFINLTNGLEVLAKMPKPNEEMAYIRIQSTACEQKRYEWLLTDLDNNFLMNLALGHTCVVIDFGHAGTPRAIWQGLEFVKFACNAYWFGMKRAYEECPRMLHMAFFGYFKALSQPVANKILYYRRFVNTPKLRVQTITGKTDHDGKYEWFAELVKKATEEKAKGASA